MGRTLEEVPVEAAVVVPLAALANSSPMKSSFFPGCPNWYPYSRRRLAKRCQSSPGILARSERLPCTTSSWESGSMKFSLKA
jgi:hypothetical protein